MHDYRDISRLMERTMHKYIQLEKQPRAYGPGILLSQTEVHTIAIIGDKPGINVTELAKIRGVTKGAASQMVYKLVDKGYVKKEISANSDTEVSLSLTEMGQIPYQKHQEYHDETGTHFFNLLRDMPKENQDYFIHLFEEFEKMIDEKLKEK